jgi:hypothetical protein
MLEPCTLLRESPNACCFTCFATRLDVLVQQLRDPAQPLVVDPDFRFRCGVCHVFECEDEVIWFVRPPDLAIKHHYKGQEGSPDGSRRVSTGSTMLTGRAWSGPGDGRARAYAGRLTISATYSGQAVTCHPKRRRGVVILQQFVRLALRVLRTAVHKSVKGKEDDTCRRRRCLC